MSEMATGPVSRGQVGIGCVICVKRFAHSLGHVVLLRTYCIGLLSI